jgi:hypothetical protein
MQGTDVVALALGLAILLVIFLIIRVAEGKPVRAQHHKHHARRSTHAWVCAYDLLRAPLEARLYRLKREIRSSGTISRQAARELRGLRREVGVLYAARHLARVRARQLSRSYGSVCPDQLVLP